MNLLITLGSYIIIINKLDKMLGPEMMFFNMDDGYPEAIVRSLRKGLLRDETYTQLKSCSNLGEFKLVLEDTDYGSFFNQD